MKKILGVLLLGTTLLIGIGLAINTYADENEENSTNSGMSISLSPVSKILQISSNSTYDNVFNVNNDGSSPIKIEVYAAPYSYIYSDEEDLYKLGFNNQNNFTQLSRWITFLDTAGNYAEKVYYTIEPGGTIEVNYRIATPNNIPSGGQYAVIFAHALSSGTSSGVRTEASPGMVIYGRSTEGEVDITAEISDLKIERSVTEENITKNHFFASAKIKNTGNVDFSAVGTMKVETLMGNVSYETPATSGRLSIIPETELLLTDEWKETPDFGLYRVTWTVTAGDQTEVVTQVFFLISPLFIIISLIVLTIIVVGIIIGVRRRKERRSRLAI